MNEVEKTLQERFLLQKEYLGNEKPINGIIPLVSVAVATYQQVGYIKECLDGILMQQVTFPYEIILGEDGSIDGTQEICKEYAERYPDKIRLFIRDRKLSQYVKDDGSITRFNGLWNRMSARGKYIAWCEGDDYWIDPLKLQKQVDCLEKYIDVSLVFSNRVIKNELAGTKYVLYYKKRYYTSNDLLGGEILGLQTICCRRECIISNVSLNINGDIEIPYNSSLHGKLYCLPEVTAVYRISGKGVATSREADQVLPISLQHMWDFHKAYNFPSKRLLIKAQTLYVIVDWKNKLRRRDYTLIASMKKMLSFYCESLILQFKVFILMLYYIFYFFIRSFLKFGNYTKSC